MRTTETDLSEAAAHVRGPAHHLTVVHHPRRAMLGVRALLLPDRKVVLGRADQHILPGVLDDAKTSREHAAVLLRGDQVTVRDLSSRNGTTVNGERIHESSLLQDGDLLGIGRTLLLLHRAPMGYTHPSHPTLLGTSHALTELLDDVELIGRRDTTVLVLGETGTGKELVAAAIHEASGRAGAFVPVNCAGLADGVVLSELFGHTRGAFSGAQTAREGLVEAAREGTLFLDEVGDAPPKLQTSLLRLLEGGDYRPVGSSRSRTAGCRFVAATQPSAEARVASGAFREDLWRRLARWVIRIPPLRERLEDVMPIALPAADVVAGQPVSFAPELALAMLRHRWPGNIRELLAFVEHAVILARGASVVPLSPRLRAMLVSPEATTSASRLSERPARRQKRTRVSADELRELLEAADWRVQAVATELGVDRKTVYRWIKSHGIDLQSRRE